jgi:hypothetical protein
MNWSVRLSPLLAVTLVAVWFMASATRRVDALGPTVLMFYGGSLKAPVYVSGQDAGAFGDLLTPARVPPRDVAGRPYLKVAAFWGPLSDPALKGIRVLTDLTPEMAWQHGKLFPPTATQPAVLLVTPLHVKNIQAVPDFADDGRFSWGGALSPTALVVLQKASVVSATKTAR